MYVYAGRPYSQVIQVLRESQSVQWSRYCSQVGKFLTAVLSPKGFENKFQGLQSQNFPLAFLLLFAFFDWSSSFSLAFHLCICSSFRDLFRLSFLLVLLYILHKFYFIRQFLLATFTEPRFGPTSLCMPQNQTRGI